jgi:uncharacterized protein YbjT (DUF2867 family)
MRATAARTVATAAATAAYETGKHRLLVLGGSGFVGGNILQRAVQKGIAVRSLAPSGKPQWRDVPWVDEVEWVQGDVFDADSLAEAVQGVTGVSESHRGLGM